MQFFKDEVGQVQIKFKKKKKKKKLRWLLFPFNSPCTCCVRDALASNSGEIILLRVDKNLIAISTSFFLLSNPYAQARVWIINEEAVYSFPLFPIISVYLRSLKSRPHPVGVLTSVFETFPDSASNIFMPGYIFISKLKLNWILLIKIFFWEIIVRKKI